jgi:acyl-CoA synthetase (AMP-forming)/AMP-acid ligase II
MHTALLLEMAAEGLGPRTALGSSGTSISFEQLHLRAQRAAALLAASQARNLVFVGLNSVAMPLALFGAVLAGRPFVPLNYRLPDEQLLRIIARTAPALAIIDDDLQLRFAAGVAGVQFMPRSAFLAATSVAGAAAVAAAAADDPDDIAVLLFTSGTTGEPKAAVLRHRHLSSYVISTVEFMSATDEEAALISVPPYHIAAVSAVLTATYAGRRVVHLAAFTPEAWVELARREAVTHAMVVPTMLGRILDVIEREGTGLPALRNLAYGGGRMPVPTIERALRLLPQVKFVNAYGLTETSSTIAVLSPADHREAVASADVRIRRHLGSVGRPLPALELEIRDAAQLPVPPLTEGEIWVRGEQVSGEYLGRKTIRADGWFPTSDRGTLDEDGFLYVGGRLDDVIVRGGENISPGEIEELMRLYPGIQDVAVVGLPDEQWGERVVAVVVADPVPEVAALRNWVRERLRSTKTPEQVYFRDALPYTDTGKLLRRALQLELTGTP